jgi:hypothetical protein
LTPFATDGLVRDFDSWQEARDYVATPRRTDYVGTLAGSPRADTWLRFAPAGLNIVGETHTYVPLEFTTAAVGPAPFIYEPFSTDTLVEGSNFKAAYLAENRARLATFGVDLASDLTRVGCESLHPKIAFVLARLAPLLANDDMTALASGNGRYLGQPVQRYVKIGWAWAKDLDSKVGKSKAERDLVEVVNVHGVYLNPFITGLDVDGFLGDELGKQQNARLRGPLRDLCDVYLPVMIELAHSDPGITLAEQQRLKLMPTGSLDQQCLMFALWRNLYFANAVDNAAQRNVRYAGMGDAHREWLVTNGRVPNGAHPFNLSRAGFDATVHGMRLS